MCSVATARIKIDPERATVNDLVQDVLRLQLGYGEEFSPYLDLDKIGAYITKGMCMNPRPGNPTPRIVETPGGMLNAIGLQNVGIDAFIEKKLPFIRTVDTPCIANFFGDTVDEYAEMAGRLDELPEIAALKQPARIAASKGTYTPLYSFIPDGLSGHDDTLKEAYGDGSGKPDAAKAKKTLEAAGVKTPVDLKLQYNPDHYGQSSADEYAAIKAQLEEGGLFKVDLQSTEWTQYNKDRNVTKDSDGSYPVYQLGWFPDYSDPDNYLSPFFRDGNFVNNGYSNKEVNDLIVKQAGETDAKAREDLLKEIQKLETDDLSTIPLLQGAQVAVTGSNVKGVVLDASFRFRYSSVTKA